MFRQKLADVADCSCRLLPNQSNQYKIFKTQSTNSKPVTKQHKQKYSLKTQTASSNKNQNKPISAQKTSLKPIKHFQDQKISISGNIDAKRQKLQKNLICSPENSNIRKLDQNLIFNTNIVSNQSYFGKTQHAIKTAQNNRNRQIKNGLLNSYNQSDLLRQQKKDIPINDFNYEKVGNYQNNKVQEIPKKSLNFEDYYKFVSNPYSTNDRNKQNINIGDNPYFSKQANQSKIRKQTKKTKNQMIPLQQIDMNLQMQIIHGSLQKYQKVNQNPPRNTFNGPVKITNKINSQNNSMKNSKNYQISLLNSKITNHQENRPYQLQRNIQRAQVIIQNNSYALTHRDYNSNANRIQIRGQKNNIVEEKITKNKQNIEQLILQQKNRTSSSTVQNSNIQQIIYQPNKPKQAVQKISKQQAPLALFDNLIKKQSNNQKIVIQRVNTFTDIMNKSAQCQSLLGQGEQSCNQNQQSVVIMRYQDLLQENNSKHDNLVQSNFILKPQHLILDDYKHYDKSDKPNNFMLDSTKVATNIKPMGRQLYSLVGDSTITTNQNMKKTVKVNKQYLTHNFSHLE